MKSRKMAGHTKKKKEKKIIGIWAKSVVTVKYTYYILYREVLPHPQQMSEIRH